MALVYGGGNAGIWLLTMGVLSFGIAYSPWNYTPDDGDTPTHGSVLYACLVWFAVVFGTLHIVMGWYDIYTLFGLVVLVLPAYRSLRLVVRTPAALRPV